MSTEMKTEIASDELKSKFIEILKSDGISDEVSQVIITEPPELKGEHMATVTVYVTVEFKDPSLKPKNLFVKKYMNNAVQKEMMKGMRIMEKESAFFNIFLPSARAFCKNYPGCESLLDFFPKCLYGDDEMVVLENVVLDQGFVMKSKEDKQDLETAKHVLGHLAQFHAANYAFVEDMGRETFLEKYEVVAAEAFMSNKNPFIEQMFDNCFNICTNILKVNTRTRDAVDGHPIEGSEEAIATFASYIGKAFPIIVESITGGSEDKLAVVNHGDCWNNNMLFKLDPGTGNITEHIFVDLQMTRYGSPNLDIGYFLFTSVKPEVRRANLKELLQHYFSAFKKTIETFRMEIPISSFEEFFLDYRKRCQMGYFIHVFMMTAIGAMKDVDMDDTQNVAAQTPEDMFEVFNTAITKWIDNNPKLVAEMSTEIVASQKEYLELQK